jgi:hypothetical protein
MAVYHVLITRPDYNDLTDFGRIQQASKARQVGVGAVANAIVATAPQTPTTVVATVAPVPAANKK